MNSRTNHDSRRGVAIILVLGILALMMLLGVAFSITMRVERTGAGNYANRVSTRQLVNATLVRALEAIDRSMVMDRTSTNHLYPGWAVLPSSGVGDSVRLGWGRGLDYVQAPLTNAALTAWSTWLDLAREEGIKGRGAFLVINESGFVDANKAAGVWSRHVGETAGELDVSLFPSVLNVTNLVTTRTNDYRYETMQEFAVLQEGYGLRVGMKPDYFSVYSRAPQGTLRDDFTVFTNLVYLGDHWSNWTNTTRRTEILAGLTNAGIAVADAPFVYTNLLDYADEDSVPQSVDSALTEAVPMLNELQAWCGVRRPSEATWQTYAEVTFELAYPFVRESPHSFTVTGTVQVVVVRSDGTELDRPALHAFSERAGRFTTSSYRRVRTATPLHTAFGGSTNDIVRVKVEAKASVLINESSGRYPAGTIVDRVTNSAFLVETTPLRLGDVPPIPSWWDKQTVSKEAVDPRFNWHAGCWYANPLGTNSIERQNDVVSGALGTPSRAAGMDWDLRMDVSDHGSLRSAGELGSLLRSGNVAKMLQTIRLYDYFRPPPSSPIPRDRVLKYFTADNATISRGRVSVNSLDEDVLKAVWRGIPVDYPESARSMTTGEVDAMVGDILAWRFATNAFENVADLGSLNWRGMMGFGTKSDLELESMITHSCRLLTTRHNLFTILLSARPFSMGLGTVADRAGEGDWIGAERAVAQVWRDPFPDAEGRHHYVMQYFRWLGAD